VANPQVEQGFTRIATALLDALPRARCTGREYAVIIAIIRLTYSWNKKTDAISAGQISKATGIARRHVQELLAELARRRMITVESRGERRSSIIGIQKDYDQWLQSDTDGSANLAPSRVSEIWHRGRGNGPVDSASADTADGALHRQTTQKRGEGPPQILAEAGRKLSPARIEKLRLLRPLGILYTAEQVAAWFVMEAPKMEAKGYRDLYRTAINWFSHVDKDDIKKAERAQRNRSFQDNRGTNGSGKAPEKPAMAPGETFVISPERLKASGDSSA